MNLARQNQLSPDDVVLLGVPSDENPSYLQGAALAPTAIREALHSPSANLGSEQGIDLGNEPRWHDLGDLAEILPPSSNRGRTSSRRHPPGGRGPGRAGRQLPAGS
jgi:arginase family enzyme